MKRFPAAVLFVVACLGVVCLGAGAFADVPVLMSYQGVLTDGSGVAVPDGPYSVTFRIYDVPSGGGALWEETDVIQVQKGTFSSILGLVVDLGILPFDMDYYLGLSIEGGAELPRAMLTSSPYSFTSRAVVGSENIFPSMGSVGIGTKHPDEKLHVAGAIRLGPTSGTNPGTIRWTGTDFEGYNGAAWRSFTETGGSLPSASSGQTLRHDGANWEASNTLYNDGTNIGIGTTAPTAKLHVEGEVTIGSPATDGALWVNAAGVAGPVVAAYPNAFGGNFLALDRAGNAVGALEADVNGTGGYLSVGRSPLASGFVVDGNFGNTGSTYMGVAGTSRSADFDMSVAGDASVMLPPDAISASEIFDEPGVASYAAFNGVTLTSSFASYGSRTITVPRAGYVLVMATTDLNVVHSTGTYSNIAIGVSTDPNALPTSQNFWLTLDPNTPSGGYYYPVTVSGMFQVAAGANTFYLVVRTISGAGSIFERNLSIMYAPTAYGTFVAPLTSTGGGDVKEMGGSALTAADIAAERTSSEVANADRMRRELDEMKERLAKVEMEMKNGQGGR